MKKKFKCLSTFILAICLMVTVIAIPSYATDYTNTPYCFYYDLYDSTNTYFGHQFFIEHTGQTFKVGYTEGEILTSDSVPTINYMYMNVCFYVQYTNAYNFKTSSADWGYLVGNTDYYYTQDGSSFVFNTSRVTSFVRSWASLSTTPVSTSSYTMPVGYTSPVTGVTYSHSIQKTLSEIISNGHDYLNG